MLMLEKHLPIRSGDTPDPGSKTLPAVSLEHPLLTKLNTVLAGTGEHVKVLNLLSEEAKRMNLNLRGTESLTGMDNGIKCCGSSEDWRYQ